jgi:hypothetical protein
VLRGCFVALCAASVVAAAGCSGHHERVAFEPCRAQDFTLEGLEWQGATGSLIGRMTFARKPGHDCRLDPMVRARILWANGLLAVPVRLVDQLAGDSPSQASSSAERVAIALQWRNWCGRGLAPKVSGPLRLSVSFGHGGVFEVPVTDRPRCDSRTDLSRAVSTRFLAA